MIATKDTGAEVPRRDHQAKAGDTPALGLPVEPGSGGKRRAYTLGIDVDATAEISVGDDVLWHEREATVVEVYPAGQEWLRVLCKIAFEDGGPSVVVGRDELELVQVEDARYFVSLAEVVLEDTAPLPSPAPRLSAEFAGSLLAATQDMPRVGDVELEDEGLAVLADEVVLAALAADQTDDEDTRPTAQLPAVDPLTAEAFTGIWRGLLNLLRLIGAFLAWPVRRDGGRALLGRIVAGVAEGVDELARQLHTHALLIAKILIAALSVAVLGGAGVLWLLSVVAR